MPWCETCDRFYNPNTLQADGTCPTCGRLVAPPQGASAADSAEGTDSGTPWHFKLLVAATVLYLTWRLLQGAFWLVDQL